MNPKIEERLRNLKAHQEHGTYTRCPRCGRNTMKPDLYTNALSRLADIMICDECYPRKTVIRGNMVMESSTPDYLE